uniref:Protein quiver n=1 Tax=Macrostomum lignano TaxID=282301 RepID=A0A1I8I2R7_9PLAT
MQANMASCVAIATKLFIAVACHTLLQSVIVSASDPEESCQKKGISCLQCSTEPSDPARSKCSDPFDPKLHKELKRPLHKRPANLSIVPCDGLCVKWIKISDTGGPSSIMRTCSTSLDLRFVQTASVCIYESRSGQGFMCFCRGDVCNAGERRP